jgi:hypothetical protein
VRGTAEAVVSFVFESNPGVYNLFHCREFVCSVKFETKDNSLSGYCSLHRERIGTREEKRDVSGRKHINNINKIKLNKLHMEPADFVN